MPVPTKKRKKIRDKVKAAVIPLEQINIDNLPATSAHLYNSIMKDLLILSDDLKTWVKADIEIKFSPAFDPSKGGRKN